MSTRFSDEERAQLDRDGYVVRERVFDTDEVTEIVDACESLLADVVANRNGRRYNVGSYTFEPDWQRDIFVKWEGDTDVVHGLEPLAHLSPLLEQWGLDRRFLDPMIDLVGDDDPVLFTEKLNLKRPRVGGVNPLHQDYPYWIDSVQIPERTATAMLFLDDATLENGTLQVVPGSHRDGPWRTRTDGDAFGNFEIDPAAEEGITPVAVEVPAGSVVFFGSFLVHKSAQNTSDRERRSLLYSYQPGGLPHSVEGLRAMRGAG